MRKIIVYIATSADGYIARADGDVAWLNRPRTAGDYGMRAFYKSIDTVLLGRKTYDLALKFGQESYLGKKNYIFSRRRRRKRAPNVEFVPGEIDAFAQQLRSVAGRDIWLVGGAELVAAFLDAGQIDEFMIHVVPVFIGAGLPLIAPRHRQIGLELLACENYADGVVKLHYRVLRQETERTKASKQVSPD
ncbi:MAG: dihydrofolate reductase [Acidobacteria bacterium]|nr:MAG: dihydrofolate reductase [Acidobacteriota bacterium]